jgi:hypothetical protein
MTTEGAMGVLEHLGACWDGPLLGAKLVIPRGTSKFAFRLSRLAGNFELLVVVW